MLEEDCQNAETENRTHINGNELSAAETEKAFHEGTDGLDHETSDLINRVADLQYANQKLGEQNSSLLRAVEMCEEANLQLTDEIVTLKGKLTSSQQSVLNAKSQAEELEEAKRATRDYQERACRLQTSSSKLQGSLEEVATPICGLLMTSSKQKDDFQTILQQIKSQEDSSKFQTEPEAMANDMKLQIDAFITSCQGLDVPDDPAHLVIIHKEGKEDSWASFLNKPLLLHSPFFSTASGQHCDGHSTARLQTTLLDSTGHVIDLVKDQLPDVKLSDKDTKKNLELLEEAKKSPRKGLVDRQVNEQQKISQGLLSPRHGSYGNSKEALSEQKENCDPRIDPPNTESKKLCFGLVTNIGEKSPAMVQSPPGNAQPQKSAASIMNPGLKAPTKAHKDPTGACTAELKSFGSGPALMRALSWDGVEQASLRNGAQDLPTMTDESFTLYDKSSSQLLKSTGYKDFPVQPVKTQKLVKLREENKLLRNQTMAGLKLPDLSETAEQERGPSPLPSLPLPIEEEPKEKSDVMPNISDVMLRKLKVLRSLPGSAPPLTEKEVENAFVQLSLAFRNDSYTLETRLRQAERERTQTEDNTDKELEDFKGVIKENKLLRNQTMAGLKLPDLSETAEQERGPSPLPSLPLPIEEEPKEKSDVMPNISDVMLRKLKVLRSLPGSAPPLTEKEVENAFVQLSLAFRNDSYTLETRLRQAERERTQTEDNTDKELEDFKGVIKGSILQWQNCEQRESYERLLETIAVFHRLASRLSSRAEMVGAVRQEKRMSKATEVMMQYVENLKRTYEKDHAELIEYKKLANQNSSRYGAVDSGEDGVPRASRSMSLTLGKALPRRRVSVAVVPKFNLLNISNQSPGSVTNTSLPPLCENSGRTSAPTSPVQPPITENGKASRDQENAAPVPAPPPSSRDEIRSEIKAKIEEDAYNKGYQEGLKRSKELQEVKEEEEKIDERQKEAEEKTKELEMETQMEKEIENKKSSRFEEAVNYIDRLCPKVFRQHRLVWIIAAVVVILAFVVSIFTSYNNSSTEVADTSPGKSACSGKKQYFGWNVGLQHKNPTPE
ncbi:UNVERIFIED_CONTAM: hypothetical protein FKN15_027084 [Acipenser sinensis]